MDAWMRYFKNAFRSVEDKLAVVLDASRCREGWLQGEFYRLSGDNDFAVNWWKYPGTSHTADFYGLRPDKRSGDVPMIAELKIVGDSYQHKTIDGRSNIRQYISSKVGDPVRPKPKQILNALAGSVLADIRRLESAASKIKHRYMILVRPYDEREFPLGQALKCLKFSDSEETWLFPKYNFDVRIWKL